MNQILDQKFKELHIIGDHGYFPIPTVSSWCGLDESIMDEMYEKIKQRGDLRYYQLVILGWAYKSDERNYKERQALLALESLGKIERKQTLLYFLDELWGLPANERQILRADKQ